MTRRVFVANRGEIAVRIIDACDRLGYETVLGVSSSDRDTLAARRAMRVVVLGPASAAASYLHLPTVVQAAVSTGCDALHPGYGFLSERSELARACAQEGIVFIGPSPEALDALGDKLTARRLAESVNVPVSAGGTAEALESVRALAAEIGYPVMVKAAFGGGGRGMKLVEGPEQLDAAWQLAASEAAAAFGDGTVFLERFVRRAKHIEVQILGDRFGTTVHLGERECSVQFRHQKVIEEAPSTSLSPRARALLHSSALAIARKLAYVGLGTIEFLYEPETDRLSFLEVNPRLQVEHPVTEAVWGIDLVREQILVCYGEPISFAQDDLRMVGHAIEARITAQDPDNGLRPSPGTVQRWRPPVGGGLRLDSHVYEGYKFPPFYDALMGKLICWGADRSASISRMRAALDDFQVEGLSTSLPLLRHIASHPEFEANGVTTTWLGDVMATGWSR